MHPDLYTSPCTKPVSIAARSLVTLSDWRSAFVEGASPDELLHALRSRLASRSGDVAVIRLVSVDELDAQVAALATMAEARPDRTALLRDMPLFGVPFAVKDNIDIEGVETTAACPAFARTAAATANVVRRLQAAGAVWIAKTNLDQFATGLVGARSPYGAPASCFDSERISGGSSSGSAVLVARGDVPFALGTDTAGSGRIPAGFNQIVGMKPTPGRVGSSGVVPACRSLDCVSVFAQTVDDAAAVLAQVEGADADDAFSRFEPGPSTWPPSLRVGVPASPTFFGDAGYEAAWSASLGALESLGHRAVPIDFTTLDDVAALLYDGPWVAERHVVVEALLRDTPDALDPAVRSVIGRASHYSATDVFRGQYRLRELAVRSAAIWSACDVLMVPTAAGHPRFAEVAADPIGVNGQLGRYTNFVNLLGWCALALPSVPTTKPLPFGVTFIAQANHDAALARLRPHLAADARPAARRDRRSAIARRARGRPVAAERGDAAAGGRRRAPVGPATQRPVARARCDAHRSHAHGAALSASRLARHGATETGSGARRACRPRHRRRSVGDAAARDRRLPGPDPGAARSRFDRARRRSSRARISLRSTCRRRCARRQRPWRLARLHRRESEAMTRTEIEAVVSANAAALGLPIAAAYRTGVVAFFTLAADMAQLVDGLPLERDDESGSVFTPVSLPEAP